MALTNMLKVIFISTLANSCGADTYSLMDHPNFNIKDNTVTIHSSWHLHSSPLYPIFVRRMIDDIKEIDGLGKELPPWFLDHHKPQSDLSEEEDETGQVKKKRRIIASSNKVKQHNAIDVICKELKEITKHDAKVYEMIYPHQLEEILQNAKMVHNTSSSTEVQMCKELLKKSGVTVAVVIR